ncbi:MAG: sulfate adenylyltransferase [Nitrososphaerales archaeon]
MTSRPHGNKLVNREIEKDKRNLKEFLELFQLEISEDSALDLENIAYGVYSPLEGFMVREDFESSLYKMRLSNNLPWSMPIVLDFDKGKAPIREGDTIALRYRSKLVGIINVEEIFRYSKGEYVERIYKTKDVNHPGVKKAYGMKDCLLGGKVYLLDTIQNPFKNYYLKPKETRKIFEEKRWKSIVAFQTRNTPHLGHEYLQKTALNFVDGLFINPVIGRKKQGDFRDKVILKTYEVLIEKYFPKDSVLMSILRYNMKYAGPREAIHHAIIRKNFGCTHIIIGRDHAGVGNYYKPYEAQEIFKEFPDLGITPLFFKEFFYCKYCKSTVNEKICPHGEEHHIKISGTKLRELVLNREKIPEEFMRPEVVKVIRKFRNPFVNHEANFDELAITQRAQRNSPNPLNL